MAKILVTGAGGFLGGALIERLLEIGHTEIRCNLRQMASIAKLEPLSKRFPEAHLEYCIGNLKSKVESQRAVNDVQLIFHLAAGLKGDAADLFLDSVVASRNLLEAIAEMRPMRMVLVSSFAVYGVATLRRGAMVNEDTPLEAHPEWRDGYSHSKLRQERLCWEYQQRYGFELVVLRPGVIYGPGGGHFSSRVGVTIGSSLLHLGGNNLIPLSYVKNCADAIVTAGTHVQSAGQIYNVHDDDLPTSSQYLRAYKKSVRKIHSISLPYFALRLISKALEKYRRYSNGQLPPVFTPYKVASLWAGNRFDNSKLHSIGWRQLVPTAEGLRMSFRAFRVEFDSTELGNRGTES